MSPIHVKLIAGAALIAAATAYLGFTGLQSGWVYFVDVDQFVASPDAANHRARVHGTVGAESADIRPAELIARFNLTGTSTTLRVEYHGAIPDLFQPGREVVVEGRLDEHGVFQADTLMTKCSSKYEGKAGNTPAHPETPE